MIILFYHNTNNLLPDERHDQHRDGLSGDAVPVMLGVVDGSPATPGRRTEERPLA